MKVFNLTDIETPKLKQRGLVNHTFAVGPALLQPGAMAEIDDAKTQHLLPGLQDLVMAGALAVGPQPPGAYLVAKAQAAPAAPPAAAAAAPVKNALVQTVPPPSKAVEKKE